MSLERGAAVPAADGRGSVKLLAAGAAGAAALTLLHVPAGTILGAVVGSAIANGTRPSGSLGRPLVVIGLVLLGASAGASLRASSVETLIGITAPLVASILGLLALDVLLALYLHRRHGVDRVTALYACAPGGLSELVLAAETDGARLQMVVAVHVVRILVVVVVALPLLVIVLGA
jgi:membrane AbrB-like protein